MSAPTTIWHYLALVCSFLPVFTGLLVFSCRTASKSEINKAYRDLAVKWHPDKHEEEEEKKLAEKKFYDIAAAKEVLTDPGESGVRGRRCFVVLTLSLFLSLQN